MAYNDILDTVSKAVEKPKIKFHTGYYKHPLFCINILLYYEEEDAKIIKVDKNSTLKLNSQE